MICVQCWRYERPGLPGTETLPGAAAGGAYAAATAAEEADDYRRGDYA